MATITWNQQVVKKNNKSLVLQMIMEKEPISRADIAQVTGLNKATVSSLVNELLEEELIFESGPGESSGGRRPVLLHFNKKAGYSIGVDIGVNYVIAILTDLKGSIVIEKNEKIRDTSFDHISGIVKNMIWELISNMPSCRYGIVGIGVGVPGIVNTEGEVLLAPNLEWKNTRIKEYLEKEFNLPIIVENEANAGAYGEKQFGAGENYHDIIYISAGIGIGVGIILNGELYRGKNGFSGEMGHMIIEVNGKPCSCGSRGCWEVYASEHALLNIASNEDLTLEELLALADDKDENAQNIFKQIGTYLGFGINNIINTFNPDQVIIGNRLAKARKWIEQPIRETIASHTLSLHQTELQLQFSQLNHHAAALGMAAFVVEEFIRTE